MVRAPHIGRRVKSLADLPKALAAAAPVQPALFEPTQTAEHELAAIAVILDSAESERSKRVPAGAAFTKGLRLAPSRTMQDTLAAGAIKLGLLLYRMRAASPNAGVKAGCERLQHVVIASIRASESLVSELDVSRVDRADAVALLAGSYLACEAFCVAIMDSGVMPVGLVDPCSDALTLVRHTLASTVARTERAVVVA